MHLAALSNDPLGDLKPELTRQINLDGSVRLATLAKSAGVGRFLFSSSCSMYGSNATSEALTEEAELKPLTAYAESKVLFEKALQSMASGSFSPVYLRNATAYGFSNKLRIDLVLNNLVGSAVATGKIKVMSDGTPWRPITHAEDIAAVFGALAVAPRDTIHNQAFNVGTDAQNYQVSDLAKIVSETVPGCQIEYAVGGGPDPRSYRVSFAKLSRALPEFRFRWDARSGAKQLWDLFKQHNFGKADQTGPRFIRLLQLRRLIEEKRLDDKLFWTV